MAGCDCARNVSAPVRAALAPERNVALGREGNVVQVSGIAIRKALHA